MLLPAAPVWPALVERRHLLAVPLNFIREPRWVLVARATAQRQSHLCTAGVGKGARRERERRSWSTGREWAEWSQCEVVEPVL